MKTRYLIALFVIICVSLFFIFSKKKQLVNKSIKRQQAGQLYAAKSISIPKGFFVRGNDAGFTVLTENDPYLVSLNLDIARVKGVGTSYYFEKRNDTSFYISNNALQFHKLFNGKEESYSLGSNEGYIAYCNNQIYYAYESAGVNKYLEQMTVLCRKDLTTGTTDTLLNMNDYIRKNYPQAGPEEYNNIAGGRFYVLDSNKVAYIPYGINRVFLFYGNNNASFIPLNSKNIIRWKKINSNVPGLGEVITFATATGEAELLNDAILYWKEKYIIINNTVFNEDNTDYCYLDIYNANTLTYEKSLRIQVNDKDNDFFLSFAVSNGYLAVLSAKGTLSTYKLTL